MSRRAAVQGYTEAVCTCAVAVVGVDIGGVVVVVDTDPDPDGEIGGLKVGARMVWTEAKITTGGRVVRHRRHRCPATEQADRARGRSDTEGPCRRYCGRRVPHAYGPYAVPLCAVCNPTRIS